MALKENGKGTFLICEYCGGEGGGRSPFSGKTLYFLNDVNNLN